MNLLKILILIISLHATSGAKVINVDDIVNQAKKQDKQLLIFFHMTYCGACKKMDRKSINDKEISSQIDRDFIFLDMNIHNDE